MTSHLHYDLVPWVERERLREAAAYRLGRHLSRRRGRRRAEAAAYQARLARLAIR